MLTFMLGTAALTKSMTYDRYNVTHMDGMLYSNAWHLALPTVV